MKKFIFAIIFSFIAIAVSAQTISFRTTSYTYKEMGYYGWTDWKPYQSSNMLITMDLTNDVVTIYSPKTQIYAIYSYNGSYVDSDGDQISKYSFVDQDGDIGQMRLVIRRNGTSELYIDFSNIIWVYSVIRL